MNASYTTQTHSIADVCNLFIHFLEKDSLYLIVANAQAADHRISRLRTGYKRTALSFRADMHQMCRQQFVFK